MRVRSADGLTSIGGIDIAMGNHTSDNIKININRYGRST